MTIRDCVNQDTCPLVWRFGHLLAIGNEIAIPANRQTNVWVFFIMGKSQRTKGHSYERAVAKRLRHIFPEAARQMEYQVSSGIDLANTGNLAIQCKRYKGYAPISKINEVETKNGRIPVLITKGDRLPDMVVLSLDDFIKILEDIGVAYHV